MANPFNQSGCWCCSDCPNHKLSPRWGLVAPCDARNNCEIFKNFQEDRKVASAIQKQEALLYNPRKTSEK